MRHSFLSSFCLVFLLFVPLRFLSALEVEFIGGINNVTFHPDRVTAHGESKNFKVFQEYPYGYGSLSLKGEISEKMGLNLFAERDNIMRNSLSGIVSASMDYISVEVGPFIGIGDTLEKPDIGITGSVQAAYPGIAFLSLHGASSLGYQYEFMGKNHREFAEARLGFWLPNMITTFSAGTKRYTHQIENKTIRDELTRFMFSADIYAKNFPLIIRIDAGYEILSRIYNNKRYEIRDDLNAVFAGFDARWQFSKTLRFIAGFEIPVYYTTVAPMVAPDTNIELYKFNAGIAYTFF
jgi:hypothetical protein